MYIDSNPEIKTGACSGVVGGDWDLNYYEQKSSAFADSLKQVVHDNKRWQDTEFYNLTINSRFWEDKSSEEILEKMEGWENLYKYIQKHGYKTQKKVIRSGDIVTQSIEQNRVPEMNEISVDIARDGTFIKHGGGHRIMMVKILEIDTIPVRVRVRHQQWQMKRDRVLKLKSSKISDHPDIKPILQ